jgi:hypothetical protein
MLQLVLAICVVRQATVWSEAGPEAVEIVVDH